MTKNSKNSGISKSKLAGGVGAAAAVSAGAYYLFGPDGKSHQKKVKQLMVNIKKEAISKTKKAKKITEPIYNNAIDSLVATYGKQYKDYQREIQAIATKLKGDWKNTQTRVKKTAQKIVRKADKKI
ncbi:MAG: hypothetical protein WD991_02555 [Candidatus Paceibacterota bacterium]